MDLKGKKVLVVGLARSGLAVSKILNALDAYVIMNDIKEEDKLSDIIDEAQDYVHEFILGTHVENFEAIDLIVLSPGVPTTLEFLNNARQLGIEIIGELELAYRLLNCNFIAITGTNGKTTTTALTGEIFEQEMIDSHVVGNIGLPAISKMNSVTSDTYLITEVSSFQLETIKQFKPKMSAILNITPDHLNRHKTMENYIATKKRIFENQKRHEYVILNYDNEITRTIGEALKSCKPIFFSLNQVLDEGVYVKDKFIYIHDYKNQAPIKVLATDEIFILGDHNIENALAATAIAYYTGVSLKSIRKGLKEFKGVEHRIEFVKEINSIKFYNDSKGTNPEASIKAIKAMNNQTILIAGGMDKGSNFEEFVQSFNDKIKTLILLGETADLIETTARTNGFDNIVKVQNMSEAVSKAYEEANPNENILLSPACASWDMYESFEHRGREFKALVYSLED